MPHTALPALRHVLGSEGFPPVMEADRTTGPRTEDQDPRGLACRVLSGHLPCADLATSQRQAWAQPATSQPVVHRDAQVPSHLVAASCELELLNSSTSLVLH